MELKQQVIKQNDEKVRAFSQITFEDDYIVKDHMPDVIKVICASGRTQLEEKRVVSGAVWLTGNVVFEIMYRSDTEEQLPQVIQGTIPFQEKVMIDNIDEADRMQIYFRMEDLSASVINSRKLAIRGLMNVEILVEEMMEEKFAYGLMDCEDCELRIEDQQMLSLLTMKHDVLRIHNELNLPKTKPNIGKIVCYYLDVRNLQKEVQNDQLEIRGDAHLCLMYLSEEQQAEWYEETMNFSGKVDCPVGMTPDLYWVRCQLQQQKVEAETDYDKEMRQLAVDLIYEVDVKAWMEAQVPLMRDVYSTRQLLKPVYKPAVIWNYLVKNEAKYRISEQIKLENGQEKILQICGYKSAVEIEHVKVVEQGLRVEGLLSVDVLFVTMDDGFPLSHRLEQLPFEEIIEVPNQSVDIKYDLQGAVEQVQVNLMDNMEYEIKAVVSIEALVLKKERVDVIAECDKENFSDMEDGLPGMVGYIVQKGENLWDIAKKYRTTMERIMETNEMTTQIIKPGDRVILVK